MLAAQPVVEEIAVEGGAIRSVDQKRRRQQGGAIQLRETESSVGSCRTVIGERGAMLIYMIEAEK